MFQIGKANFNEQPNNTVTWSYKREVPQFGKGRKLLAVPKWLISISLGSMMRSKEDCPEGSGLGLLFSLCKQNHFVLRDKQQRHLIFIFKKRLSWSKCFGVFFFLRNKKKCLCFLKVVYAHRVLRNVFLHSEECIRRLLCPVSGLGPCARSVICMIYLAYTHFIPPCHLHIHWVRLWEPNLFCKQDLGFWLFSFCDPHHSPCLWGQYVTHGDEWTCLAPLLTCSVEAQGEDRLYWSPQSSPCSCKKSSPRTWKN